MKRKKGKEKADACVLAFPLMLTKIRTCRPRKRREDAVDVGDENEENSDVDEEQTDEGESGSDDAVDEGAGGEENGLPARFSCSP